MPHVVEALRQDRPAALLFGPEPTGLSNEIVTRCQYLIQIPTAAEYASLNLAQAVAICVYELHKAWHSPSRPPGRRMPPPREIATIETQEQMFRQLQTALEEIHFLYGDKAEPLMHAVRHLLGKAALTDMESRCCSAWPGKFAGMSPITRINSPREVVWRAVLRKEPG